MAFRSLGISRLEFRASSSLETGQCFHWKRVSQQEWLGVIRDQAVVLRSEEEDTLARALNGDELDLQQLRAYLNLDAPELVPARRKEMLEAYQTAGAGRVPSHVEELASHGKLYGFPTLQALAELPEEDGLDLHACGLGYRSPYLHGTLRALRAGLDLEALHCSLGTGRAEAERTLQRLPGVGPKVAACVALYGLGFHDAVPVDVHVSTELQHAQQLCRSLLVGHFQEDFRLVAGWWALALQYSTALCVLFVSLSIVLGATSCVGCFLKIFSVFIIVDMDNLAAKFVNGMVVLDFHVVVDPERLKEYRRRHKERIRGCSIRTIFMIMPVTLILVSWVASLYFNTTPLTLLAFGQVDNAHAPKMISIGDCCPPIMRLEHLKGQDVAANVSVLLLAAMDRAEETDGPRWIPRWARWVSEAPRLYWIALESQAEPITPSSLQVLQGTDANNNAAFRFGSAVTTRRGDRLEKMYKTTEPFEASFLISGIQAAYPTTYTVFVTAQNPQSRALASQPARGSLLIPACASFCKSCELAGARFCDPGQCIEGTHYHAGRCYPCVENCDSCDFMATPLDFGFVNLTDQESIQCDRAGCKQGFGYQGRKEADEAGILAQMC
eukprot:g18029.t1